MAQWVLHCPKCDKEITHSEIPSQGRIDRICRRLLSRSSRRADSSSNAHIAIASHCFCGINSLLGANQRVVTSCL
jgi:hypothetical protein